MNLLPLRLWNYNKADPPPSCIISPLILHWVVLFAHQSLHYFDLISTSYSTFHPIIIFIFDSTNHQNSPFRIHVYLFTLSFLHEFAQETKTFAEDTVDLSKNKPNLDSILSPKSWIYIPSANKNAWSSCDWSSRKGRWGRIWPLRCNSKGTSPWYSPPVRPSLTGPSFCD